MLRTVAFQSLLSMEFSTQEYWSGLPFPTPGDLPDPGIESSHGRVRMAHSHSKTTEVLAEVTQILKWLGRFARSLMSGALDLTVSLVPCFFFICCLLGSENLRWFLHVTCLRLETDEAAAYSSVFPSMYLCTWLTWASPQYGSLRAARKLRFLRGLVPRVSGRSFMDS